MKLNITGNKLVSLVFLKLTLHFFDSKLMELA